MRDAVQAAEVVLRRVGNRYGAVTAVRPVDLTIRAGTLVTLLGPSGCGKTTLLRMVAGLERVSEGQILIGGRDVTDLSAGERNVSMVFQSYALFPHMSVRENVAYGLLSSGVAKRDARDRAEAALATVGLAGFGDRLPSEISGGQQQRSRSPARSSLSPTCSCSTSRSRTSTRACADRCGRRSARSSSVSASRSCT
jgi:iron(III) transport system ATP-binding protein